MDGKKSNVLNEENEKQLIEDRELIRNRGLYEYYLFICGFVS